MARGSGGGSTRTTGIKNSTRKLGVNTKSLAHKTVKRVIGGSGTSGSKKTS